MQSLTGGRRWRIAGAGLTLSLGLLFVGTGILGLIESRRCGANYAIIAGMQLFQTPATRALLAAGLVGGGLLGFVLRRPSAEFWWISLGVMIIAGMLLSAFANLTADVYPDMLPEGCWVPFGAREGYAP